jgi:mannose-6-phosphate isomerase
MDEKQGEMVYRTEAEEFQLSVIHVKEGTPYWSPEKRSVEMMICTEGTARISGSEETDGMAVNRGTSILVPAAADAYQIQGEAVIYKASVPL